MSPRHPRIPKLQPVNCPTCSETDDLKVSDISRTWGGNFRELTCLVCGTVFYSGEGRIDGFPAGALRRRVPPDFKRRKRRGTSRASAVPA